MQIFRFKAGSDEWKQKRKEVITGTEIGALFGLNPYLSLPALRRKKSGEDTPLKDNPILRAGRMGEPTAIASALEMGLNIEAAAPSNHVTFVIDDSGRLGTSLDALLWHPTDGQCIVECKSSEKEGRFQDWQQGNISDAYLLQIQMQLGCTQLDYAYFIGIHNVPTAPTVVYRIKRNPTIFKIFQEAAAEFNSNPDLTVNQDQKKAILQELYTNIEFIGDSWVKKEVENETIFS